MKENKTSPISGDYGYIDYKRNKQLLKVGIWVVLIAAIIIGGWIYFGTRLNMVTVPGIILVLPAAKSVVGLIIIWPYHTGSIEDYNKVKAIADGHCALYADLVLTRYEGSMNLSIAMIHGGNIFAYIPKQKMETAKIKEYLTTCVRSGGGSASAIVCTDIKKYMEYANKIAESDMGITKKDEAILSDLLSRAV